MRAQCHPTPAGQTSPLPPSTTPTPNPQPQNEAEPALLRPELASLHRALWRRIATAIQRSSPAAAEAAKEARIAARSTLRPLEATPAYVAGGALHPHQLHAVSWLRRQWGEGNGSVLADERGLGKTATALAFLQSLRADFACSGPLLVLAPAAALPYWQGEFSHWLGAAADVVAFHGSAAARAIVAEHELWLSPACLDGRPLPGGWQLSGRVPLPDVVLARWGGGAGAGADPRGRGWGCGRSIPRPILLSVHPRCAQPPGSQLRGVCRGSRGAQGHHVGGGGAG